MAPIFFKFLLELSDGRAQGHAATGLREESKLDWICVRYLTTIQGDTVGIGDVANS